jgi:bifunctional non-homologous end joining protein LigD
MAEAFAKLPAQSAVLDGELCLIDPRGAAHFCRLMAQMRTSSPDESQLLYLAFDLLHRDGVDLRGLPLTERRRDLERLRRNAKVPYFSLVETFPDGAVLFDYCNRFGFEGIVSKRRSSRYSSGPSRNWVNVKCPGWKRINAERWRIFAGPAKPALTEAQGSRKSARSSPGRSSGCDRQGCARV